MKAFLNVNKVNRFGFEIQGFAGNFWLIFPRVLKASGGFIPWRFVYSWDCVNCGDCCRKYNVNLGVDEWLRITRIYGDVVASNLGKLVLKRRVDGSCVFLYRVGGRWICGLQSIKPKACMLWPFYVKEKPVYGYGEFACYNHNGLNFYIYVDTFCKGLIYGLPSKKILNEVLPEVVKIYLGKKVKQQYTTSSLDLGVLGGIRNMVRLLSSF